MRTIKLIVSDLHVASGDTLLDGFGQRQQAALEGLLSAAGGSPLGEGDEVELILNGDCLDFLIAETLRSQIGAPLPAVQRAGYARSVEAARSSLGGKAFAAAWAEGQAMTSAQVLAELELPMISPLSPEPAHVASTLAPPAKISPADGLTAREVEILRLVAQGKTDAQIAEQLVISPRTVNWHLTSIYNKLQVSSRAAATRYAIERHVV